MNDDFKRPLGPTTKVQEAEPVENEPPVTMGAPIKPVKEKKKHSKAFSFVSVLLLLAILGVGVMTYFWYDAQNKLDDANQQLSALQSDLAITTKEDDLPVVSMPTKEDAIIAAAKEYAVLKGGNDKENTYEIAKSNEAFAVVNVGNEADELTLKIYLARGTSEGIDGQNWIVIYEGQDVPPQEIIDRFNIPEDF